MVYIPGKHTYSVTGDLHTAEVGAFCSIAGGVTIHTDMNHAWVYNRKFVSTFPFREMWKIDSFPVDGGVLPKVKIGNDVWICASVNILPGLVIGDGAIVAAHSVVTRNVPPYAIVAGNPARIKSYRFPKEQIKALLKIKWYEWDDEVIKERIEDFKDINLFIKKYG